MLHTKPTFHFQVTRTANANHIPFHPFIFILRALFQFSTSPKTYFVIVASREHQIRSLASRIQK
ncbi:unnamed protein product [Haemonchus placei]|uniref:Uncharacterized protein n=1 Tax=Haemonchus placei TaxID=6290 RepID=A0A3P7X923_HAEPC|nr:unnamed protein product [Haemonchus placei]